MKINLDKDLSSFHESRHDFYTNNCFYSFRISLEAGFLSASLKNGIRIIAFEEMLKDYPLAAGKYICQWYRTHRFYVLRESIPEQLLNDLLDAVATNGYASFKYAIGMREISIHNKERFFRGEKEIFKNSSLAYEYVLKIVLEECIEAEEAIKKSPHYSFLYATTIRKRPWDSRKDEFVILKDPAWCTQYRHFKNNYIKKHGEIIMKA